MLNLAVVLTSDDEEEEEEEEEEDLGICQMNHIKLNQINAKGGLPEEQTLINAGRPYHITIM